MSPVDPKTVIEGAETVAEGTKSAIGFVRQFFKGASTAGRFATRVGGNIGKIAFNAAKWGTSPIWGPPVLATGVISNTIERAAPQLIGGMRQIWRAGLDEKVKMASMITLGAAVGIGSGIRGTLSDINKRTGDPIGFATSRSMQKVFDTTSNNRSAWENNNLPNLK